MSVFLQYLAFLKVGFRPKTFLRLSAETLHRSQMLTFTVFASCFYMIFTLEAFFGYTETVIIFLNVGGNILLFYILAFVFLGNFRQFAISRDIDKVKIKSNG